MYANRFMQNFAPTQTVTGHILDKNPVPPNIKSPRTVFAGTYGEQNKHIPLSPAKNCFCLQTIVEYGLPEKWKKNLWIVVGGKLSEKHPLA